MMYTLWRKSNDNVREMDQRSFLLNSKTSHTANQLGNQKKISLLRWSSSPISKKVQTKEPAVMQVLVPMFNLFDKNGQKYFEVGKHFISPLLACFILTVMFTDVNLGANVRPDVEPRFDLTKFPKVTILDSRYIKITLTCNYRNIFRGNL